MPKGLRLAQILQQNFRNNHINRQLVRGRYRGVMEVSMLNSAHRSIEYGDEELSQRFGGRLRVVSKQAVTVWFNQDRIDRLLASYIGTLEGCELIYAIDTSGRQVSSNIHPNAIDGSAYGQDLSQRPYSLSLSVLNNVASHGAFACDAYVSNATQSPCITLMHGATSGSSLLGFVAVDFYPGDE